MFDFAQKSAEIDLLKAEGNLLALHAFAEQNWRVGHYDDAILAFQALVDLEPANGEYLLALAKAESNFHYNPDLFIKLDRLTSESPDQAKLIHFLCQAQIAMVSHEVTLTRCLKSLERSTDYRALQLFYQAILVLKGLQPIESLRTFTDNPRDVAAIQALQLCNREKNHARVFGLPMEMLRFFAKRAPADGLVIECGVYFGKSIRVLADEISRPIYGFDSFQGLPEDWKPGEPKGSYSTNGKMPAAPNHVHFVQGWFEQQLPPFIERNPQAISILHIDCDLYSSTKTVLEACRTSLKPGSIIIFDDLLGYPGWELHEWRAFIEFVQTYAIKFRFIGFVFLGREVAIEIL